MTTTSHTPTVWLAGAAPQATKSLLDRLSSFAVGHDANELLASGPGPMLSDIGQHATAWLVVFQRDQTDACWADWAQRCRAVNENFRCLVIGAEEGKVWPEDSIFLPSNCLSTIVLDRLRVESHALRMASNRQRHIARLMRR
ncbi:MAG: hypothetical protein RJA19_145 [Bacteroidota bacterium]|jgi:hypothetical protein